MKQPAKGTALTVDKAKAALAEVEVGLVKLMTDRDTALLTGADDAAIAQIDAAIEAAQRARRTNADRLRLLEAEAERHAAERRVKEKAELIGRIEQRLVERDKAGAALAAAIAEADGHFVRLIELGREITAAWPWQPGDVGAIGTGENAVMAMLQHETYRVAGRPSPGGGLPHTAPPSYPGGRAEQLEWAMLPGRITPLVEKLAAASAAASRILRTGKNLPATNGAAAVAASNGHVPPANVAHAPDLPVADNGLAPVERTHKQIALAQLLVRQDQLAMLTTAEAEAEYAANGKLIQELSA